MWKRMMWMCLVSYMMVWLAGCGSQDHERTNVSKQNDTQIIANVEENAEAENLSASDSKEITQTQEETKVHEHEYTYQSTQDECHDKTCLGCGDSLHESCTFDMEGRCNLCGYQHEHDYIVISNENNTHSYICKSEWCGHEEAENCIFDENRLCTVCGYEHQHSVEYYEKEAYKYYAKCSFENCEYEEFAWEIEAMDVYVSDGTHTYTNVWRNQEYYLTEDCMVYDIPSETGNIIGSASKDDLVTVIGRVWKCFGEQPSFYSFFALSDGTYIPGIGENDLLVSLCKSNQIQVHKSPDQYTSIYWMDPKTLYNIYGSIDEALISITSHDLSWFKTNGTFRVGLFGEHYYDVVTGQDGIRTITSTVKEDGSWLIWNEEHYHLGGQK